MKKFAKRFVPEETIKEQIASTLKSWRQGDPILRTAFKGKCEADVLVPITEAIRRISTDSEYWRNDKYQVAVREELTPIGVLVHLSIKRLDRQVLHDWRELQEIKNELVGRENEGVEMYPAESRVLDTANQYHLWVFKDPTLKFPFGFTEGGKTVDSVNGSINRPFEV